MTENHAIQQEIRVQASPQKVFEALTRKEALESWFPSQVESDPRPGGSYTYVFKYPDPEQGGTQTGKYVQVEPARRVSYTWEAAGVETQVDFRLRADQGATLVSLEHAGFGGPEPEKVRAMHEQVWGVYLQNLKSFLEQGVDNRTAGMGQITR